MSATKDKSVHVIPSDNKWRVVRSDAKRASAVRSTKSLAVEIATTIAKNDNISVIVHRNDGKITSVERFPRGITPSARSVTGTSLVKENRLRMNLKRTASRKK